MSLMLCLYALGLLLMMAPVLWRELPIGTKSLLCGAHCWFLHPLFVAAAWIRLYGWPNHPALWLSFLVHDWGYWGKRAMDSEEGETHPLLGARIISELCDASYSSVGAWETGTLSLQDGAQVRRIGKWGKFCLLHSRYYAKRLGLSYSRLCVADKWACFLTPWWVYLPCVLLTGEVWEYVPQALACDNPRFNALRAHVRLFGMNWQALRLWHRSLGLYMQEWATTHRDGEEDTWTQSRFTQPQGKEKAD